MRIDSEQGLWWVSGREDIKVQGALSFKPDTGIELELYGLLTDLSNLTGTVRIPSINGVTISGKNVTLLNCVITGAQLQSPGGTVSSVWAQIGVVGGHFKSIDDFCLDEVSVHFPYIKAWSGMTGIRFMSKLDENPIKYECEYHLKKVIANTNEFDVAIVNVMSLDVPRTSKDECLLREKVFVELNGRSMEKWTVWYHRIRRLQDFLTLVVGVPVFPLEVTTRWLDTNNNKRLSLEIYVAIKYMPQNFREILPYQMMLTMEAAGKQLSRMIQSWFELEELLVPACDLYFSRFYEAEIGIVNKFLSSVMAIEVLDRHVRPEKILNEDEEKRIREELEKISESLPKDLATWFSGKFKYFNGPSLAQRLRKIEQKFHGVLEGLSLDAKTWSRKIADSRNFLVHRDKSLEERCARGEDLHRLCDQLRFVVEAYLLSLIGLSDEQAVESVTRSQFYLAHKYLINQEKRVNGAGQ